MSNLPINWQDKENSPGLQAYLAQFGRQFYIDADEANQVRDAINELAEGTFPDMVLKSGKAEITGLNMSIAANAFAWRINQVTFSNPPAFNKTLTAASEGNYRADILVGTTEGTYLVVQGPESPNAAIEPDAPDGTIRLTGVVLFGAVVGQPTPTPTTNYVQKSERANVYLTGSGVINQWNMVDERAIIVFKGTITRLNTISYASVPYNGKTIRLFNAQNTPVTIGNAVSGYGVDFVFSDGQDYVLQPNQTIEFSFDMTYFPYAHHMFIGPYTFGVGGKKPIPFLSLDLVSKGSNEGVANLLLTEEVGDIFEGWKNETTYWVRARWNGGDRIDRENYTPLQEIEF